MHCALINDGDSGRCNGGGGGDDGDGVRSLKFLLDLSNNPENPYTCYKRCKSNLNIYIVRMPAR